MAAPLTWWAIKPMAHPDDLPEPALIRSASDPIATSPTRSRLEPDVFNVALWNAPPSSVVTEVAPKLAALPSQPSVTAPLLPRPPTFPLRLQLIGIIRDSDEIGRELLRAAVYDPEKDALLVVSAGQTVGTRRVDTIDSLGVTFVDASHAASDGASTNVVDPGPRTRLLLRTEPSALPGVPSPASTHSTKQARSGANDTAGQTKPGDTP